MFDVNFVRRQVAMALARPMIEGVSDFVEVTLGKAMESCPFRKVVANQPVGVLHGASLGGAVRMAKINRGARGSRHVGMSKKFSAVVDGKRMDGAEMSERDNELRGGLGFLLGFKLAKLNVERGPVNDRQDATRTILADD